MNEKQSLLFFPLHMFIFGLEENDHMSLTIFASGFATVRTLLLIALRSLFMYFSQISQRL